MQRTKKRHLIGSLPQNWVGQIVTAAVAACALTLMSTTFAAAEQPGIMCVQNQLNALGFNAGTPDGTIGPKTRSAAEEYRAWMAGGAGEEGWSQPPLTALNGKFWCQKVGEAHPEVAKFAAISNKPTYEVAPGEMLASFDVPLAGKVSAAKFYFEFKTQCENDHRVELIAPSGRTLVAMERGLNRCSGKSTVFTSDNVADLFVGSNALGTWKIRFSDLDANNYAGALTKARVTLSIDVGGETMKYIVNLTGLPKKVPNPE